MPFNPLYMKASTLTIDATDFQAQVSAVAFVPSSSTATWKGLAPGAVHTKTSAATWTLNLTLAQDYDEAASLARYLLEHEGESVTAIVEPVDGGQGYTATVQITPGQIGGAIDSFAEATVTLGVEGKPVATV